MQELLNCLDVFIAYYRCGPGNGKEVDYDDACTKIGANFTYEPDLAIQDIRQYESQGLIEDTRNLRNKRLYVYAGSRSAFFDLGNNFLL